MIAGLQSDIQNVFYTNHFLLLFLASDHVILQIIFKSLKYTQNFGSAVLTVLESVFRTLFACTVAVLSPI